MTYPTERIQLPDKLVNYRIHPKWKAYRPKFVFFAPAGPNNWLTGETPQLAGNVTAFPTFDVNSAGKNYENDGGSGVGLVYDRETGNVGSEHAVFMVMQAPTTPGTGQILANGNVGGSNKPFNYRLLWDTGFTRGIRYNHDTGPNAETWDFDLSLKDSEPSTVSFAVNGTDLQFQVDDQTNSKTLAYTPVDTGEGSFRIFQADGAAASTSGDFKLNLLIVFDEFVPPDVIDQLHRCPQSFFQKKTFRVGKAAVAAAFNYPLHLRQTLYRKTGWFV